jgi:hypothetical protein
MHQKTVVNAGRISLATLLLLLTCHWASAQCTQKLSDLPAAPEFLGFHMGMSKEEIHVLVPQTQFGRTDDFGVSKTTINPYFDTRIDKTRFPNVRSVSLDLLDNRLTSFWVGYDETYKVQKLDEFVKVVSQSLRVPESWSSWKSRGQQLRCVDFQLIVTTVAGGPSLRIVDVGADDTIAARRQAKEEKDAAAEAGVAEGGSETPEILGDKQAKTYYANGCQPTREVLEQNKITFKTVEEAEKAGFKPAKNCH